MQLLSDLILEYQELTKDTSTKNKSRGIRRMNESHRRLCKGNYWWLEKEFIITSVASEQAYDKPVGLGKVISIRYTNDNRDTVLQEVVSPSKFDALNREGVSVTSDYPIYWHERDGQILVFPTPSSSGKAITVIGKRRPGKLELEDYTTGTISVTNGTKTVTGDTTGWTSIKPGTWIIIDDIPYEVGTVDSSTQITLVKAYEGATDTGLSYRIGDAPVIPEEFHDLIWMDASLMYDLKRKDSRLRDIKVLFDEMKYEFDTYSKSRSTRNVISKRKNRVYTSNDYPQNLTSA